MIAPDLERQISKAKSIADMNSNIEATKKITVKEKEVSISRVLQYGNIGWLLVGLFISVIVSAANPIFGWMMCEMLFVLLVPQSPTFEHESNFWCGWILAVSGIFGISSWI